MNFIKIDKVKYGKFLLITHYPKAHNNKQDFLRIDNGIRAEEIPVDKFMNLVGL